MKTVAVLGSGPAGLFAAWAAIERGDRVTVLSSSIEKPKGETAGVFVIHSSMGLPLRAGVIVNKGFGGTAQDYAVKLYGDPDVKTSFPAQPNTRQIWDGGQAVDLAWDIVSSAATMRLGSVGSIADVRDLSRQYDFLVNTIPLNVLGVAGLSWQAAYVKASYAPPHEMYSLYNAHPDAVWYRASAAFGRFTIEYTREQPGAFLVKKVVGPRGVPSFSPPNILFTGRYGAWDKSELSDAAYHKTRKMLNGGE